MKQNQYFKHENPLKTDYVAWRVSAAKRREKQTQRDKEYNLRPRLRSEAHH